MKLAWLCFEHFEDGEVMPPAIIKFVKPERFLYRKIIPIVYAELDTND